MIDAQHGGFKLQPWDWDIYGEQVRKAKYDLDESQIKPYFELNSVLQNGVFFAANQLYGITFKERKDIPVYEPDVRVFDVIDANGKPLALFYCDYFKRDNKNGGAWMSEFVGQSNLLQRCRSSTTSPICRNRRPGSRRSSVSTMSRPCFTSSAMRCMASFPIRSIRVFQAPRRRATSLSFPRSSMNIGRSIPACSRITPGTTRPARPCPRSWWTR